jgi:PAS domain S-box-containing protein
LFFKDRCGTQSDDSENIMPPKSIIHRKKTDVPPNAGQVETRREGDDVQLRLHDLEGRNEMLARSLADMQKVLRQYIGLYDFAPIGYFTLNRNGLILQANLSGAQLLDMERKELLQQRFVLFVSVASRPVFNPFLERVFESRKKETCDIELLKNGAGTIWVRVEATYSDTLDERGGTCHLMVNDITAQKRAENILQARLRITEFAAEHSLPDLLQNALDELCALTDSPIGFFHFVEEDQRTLWLQTWSTRTLKEMCTAEGKGSHYSIDQAGVWVDCVRQGRPVIHNDYASLPHRRGLPEGHAPVIREMVFPIMRHQKIMAIIGVGNKLVDYTEDDLAYASRLADLIWDITERKRAETQKEAALEALRQSEGRYRSILEDQTELICRYLPDGRLSYVNEAYARYYGETAQDLINTNFIPHIPEPDISMVIGKISGITQHEPVVVYEHRIIKPDSEIRWQHWTHRGVYNAAGELIEHQAVGNDITERKRAEEGLQRYLSELKVLYDNGLAIGSLLEPREIGEKIIETLSSNLSWHHIVIRLRRGETDDLDLIAFNQSNLDGQEAIEAEKKFRVLVSKIDQGLSGWVVQTGQPFRSGRVQTHPKYVNLYSGVRSGMYMPLKIAERAIGCISVESEEEDAFTEQDERLLATLAAQTAISFENARLYQDIQQELWERERAEEALRESEERLRYVLDNVQDAVWSAELSGQFVFLSPMMSRIYGRPLEELLATPNFWIEAGHPEDQDIIRASGERLLCDKKVFVEYRIILPDGEVRWVADQKFLVQSNPDKPARLVGVVSDITNRKQMESALATERRRLADILKGTNAGTWEWNVQTGETIFNERWANIVGYTLAELSPISIETWVRLAHPDDLKISGELLEQHFKGETDYYEMEARMRHKDGHWVWVIDRGKVATWTTDGKPLLMSGTHQDITARKQAEEQIQFLAKLPSEDPNPVLRITHDGTLLYINEAGLQLLPQWNLQVGEAAPPMLQDVVFRSMQDGKTQTLDLEHHDRMFAFYVAPIVSAGYANLYGHDITESRQAKALKDAETRYHVLFDQSPYGVLLVDPETGNMIEANEMTSRQLGYTREEFAALKIPDYEATEDPKEVARHMQKIISEGSDDFETLHRTKSGELRNVHVWVKTLQLDNRPFFYTIYQDITERRRAEEANEAYSREITLLEERQRIASDLHDAVSQTLFSARLTAEALLRQPDRQADSFTRSLTDLNRLVRSAGGEIRLVLVELRNNALLNSNLGSLLTNLIDSSLARTNANLAFQCDASNLTLPAEVKLAFYRIAQEAINNAIKHAKPANITCVLRENGQMLELVVKDDGSGFLIDKVSDDHFGLQIMHERADQAGVKLGVESQPGCGTSITVCWEREP